MSQADQLAINAGTSGPELMEAAGRAVARVIRRHWPRCAVSVLCGPGNNGGDGFVAARILREAGWPVRLGLLGGLDRLTPDAGHHAALWGLPPEPLDDSLLDGAGLVVDALFGAGLSRPVDGAALRLIKRLAQGEIPVCAIDVPTGVDGATGEAVGIAVQAQHTVSFFRKKPAHVLAPGRFLCGELTIADIGIPESVLASLQIAAHENHPDLWRAGLPRRQADQHKYHYGHVLVRGGDVMTGAARLAATAAARVGAGLVSVAAGPGAWPVYAAALTSIMVLPSAGAQDWRQHLSDMRRNAIVVGPGAGASAATREDALAALETGRSVVLDADAITAFAHTPAALFNAIQGPCVLTPHEGEFRRLFPLPGSKLERARLAARQSGAVIVLKGPDTVIAAPDGRAIVNTNAPPELATAGSGDVLTGLVAGLLAQGMDAFYACAAAVWMHGRAATVFGPGLMAEDLPERVPSVLRELSCRPVSWRDIS